MRKFTVHYFFRISSAIIRPIHLLNIHTQTCILINRDRFNPTLSTHNILFNCCLLTTDFSSFSHFRILLLDPASLSGSTDVSLDACTQRPHWKMNVTTVWNDTSSSIASSHLNERKSENLYEKSSIERDMCWASLLRIQVWRSETWIFSVSMWVQTGEEINKKNGEQNAIDK